MGRGLSRCQPSNSIRLVRSPVASETSKARITITDQAGQTALWRRLFLEDDFESIIGAQHFERRPVASQGFIANAVVVQSLDDLIVMQRIVVKQREAFGAGLATEINRDDVAGVTPMFLRRARLSERIHGVADDQIGLLEEADEGHLLVHVVDIVFAVGTVDHGTPNAVGEAVAETLMRVVLAHRRDMYAIDLHFIAGPKCDEADVRFPGIEGSREKRLVLLSPKRLFGVVVAGMNHDFRVRIERRQEGREAHDMVPVHMRQEEIIFLRTPIPASPGRIAAHFLQSAAHVADEIGMLAAIDLDAAGCAAIGRSRGEIELVIDETARVLAIGKGFAARGHKHIDDLASNVARGDRYRQRSSRSPETHCDRVARSTIAQEAVPSRTGSVSST